MSTPAKAVAFNDDLKPEGGGSVKALRKFMQFIGAVASGATAELRWVSPAMLSVDRQLQRPTKFAALQFLIKNWNVALCSPLTASLRSDGSMIVICGQHRWMAAKAAGEALIPVLVWTGLTTEDESKIFLAEDHRVRISTYDRLKLRQLAGDQDALDMTDVVVDAGFAFSHKTGHPEPNKIVAIGAVESAFSIDRGRTLKSTLGVLRKAFGSDTSQLHGGLITGVSKIVLAYGDHVDHDVLARVLKSAGVLGVKSQANLVAAQGQGHGWLAWAIAVLSLYNGARSPSKRLMADVLRASGRKAN